MGKFEKYLSIWVALAILAGLFLGNTIPSVFQTIGTFEVASVNIPVAILIWLMIYPMMIQIDFSSLSDIAKKPKGILLTIFVNWLVKPFSMALIASLFFDSIYSGIFPSDISSQYIAGMILLGVAPCTAMVFVWSQLTDGDPGYTLIQVAVNDIIMIFAFVPVSSFLLGLNDITVPWDTLILSVMLYVVIPLLAGVLTRKYLVNGDLINNFAQSLKPLSITGLILTVVILFAIQAPKITSSPLSIALIAIPLIIQTYGIFMFTYYLSKLLKLPHRIASPASMIGASNFFELAVAVAISLFGLNSGAALATVVGVLVEVPVMLSLVVFSNRTKNYFREYESSEI